MAEETEVLSLEAQSLSARVSAALQKGLNAAADDLAAAKRKSKRTGGASPAGGIRGPAKEGGDNVYGEGAFGSSTTADDSSVSAASVSSKNSTGSRGQSRRLFRGGVAAGGGG